MNIVGDMQQVWRYAVKVTGDEGKGGVSYGKIEATDGDTLEVTQFFSKDQLVVKPVKDLTSVLTIDNTARVVCVEYKKIEEYRKISSLSELNNEAFYHITAKSGEGYLAWNSAITDTYVSLRGVTNTSYNGETSNTAVLNIYREEVTPFDLTVVWQILLEDGKYYLYQPAKKEYVTRLNDRDYGFTAEKTALDAIRDNGDGTFGFHAGGGYSDNSQKFACIVTNEASIAVRNWTWSDHGSIFYIYENPNIDLNAGDEGSSIGEALVESSHTGIYNLQGKRLEALPTSGIAIVNNKKVYVK